MSKLVERRALPQKQKHANNAPKYMVVAAQLRDRIQRRELVAGDRLPSFAELRAQYGVMPTTAERIYSLLESDGMAERRQGSGTFVVEPRKTLTGSIGFVGRASEQKYTPFHALLVEGMQIVAESGQQHLLYMGRSHALDVQACTKVDGMMICNIEDGQEVTKHLPPELPRVSLLNHAPGMTSVVADDYNGARLAIQHLLALGHQRIACLLEKTPSLARRRFVGYSDALLEAGTKDHSRWTRLTNLSSHDKNTDQPYLHWGHEQMRNWLQKGWRESGCTAIFAQNDVAAIGVMQALSEAGVSVPRDISVIGFDGTAICDLVSPRLTAIKVPLTAIGARGMEMLNRQINGEERTAQTIVLPVHLRAGESTAPPA